MTRADQDGQNVTRSETTEVTESHDTQGDTETHTRSTTREVRQDTLPPPPTTETTTTTTTTVIED